MIEEYYYDTYGQKRPILKLTHNEVVTKSQKSYAKKYIKTRQEIKRLSKIIAEDNKRWVGIEGKGGHWTGLPNGRTLSQHWCDEGNLKKLQKEFKFLKQLDYETPVSSLSDEQYYLFLTGAKMSLDKECQLCHNSLRKDEEFLYLPDVFDYDGWGVSIQLCKNCIKSFMDVFNE